MLSFLFTVVENGFVVLDDLFNQNRPKNHPFICVKDDHCRMEKVDSYCGFEQGVARNITKDSVTKNLTKPCKDDGENGERLVHHIYERFVQRVLMD